jgi:DNA-binding transcriptional MerR regulator
MPLSFLKKGKETKGKGFIPIDRVKELASRGFSETEIIDTLRSEGFSPKEIDEALTRAITSAVSEPKKEEKKEELPTFSELMKESSPSPETSSQQINLEPFYPQYDQSSYSEVSEDYIEALIEARMSEVNEKISQMTLKYSELEKKIEAMSEKINQMAEKRGEEQKEILMKIDSLKGSLDDLVVKTEAIEKAFKDTLPALIESVRALSEIVQKIKSAF